MLNILTTGIIYNPSGSTSERQFGMTRATSRKKSEADISLKRRDDGDFTILSSSATKKVKGSEHKIETLLTKIKLKEIRRRII